MLRPEVSAACDDWRQAVRCFSNGEWDAAHRALHAHLTDHPECGKGWEFLGMVHFAARQLEAAQQALEHASALIPLGAEAECALADCYLGLGKRQWACELYQAITQRGRVSIEALLGAAQGLNRLGQPGLSVIACRRAIALDPELAQPHFDLSYYLLRSAAPASVVEASAQRAIALDPGNPAFRVGLAGYFHSLGRWSEAARLLAPMTCEQIRSMHCRSCLERIGEVFAVMEDRERADCCRLRLMLLDEFNDGTSC